MFLHSLLPSAYEHADTRDRTFLNSLLSRHDDKRANNCVKQECGLSCISTRFHCSKPRGGSGAGIGSDGGRIRTARAEFTQRGDEKVIPADLLPHLSDHQRQGVALAKAAMDKQGAFLLADSTGVGKTRQQIAIAKMYADEGKRVLIVSKSSILQPDWNKKKMNGAFSADGKEMKVGIRLAAQRSDIRKGYVAATTYDRLDKIAGGVGKNTVLILDEAHSFKNRSSDRSRTGIKALERAEKVLYATATPIDKIDHLDYLGRLGVFGDRTGRQFRRFANSKDPDAIGLHSTISERFDSLTKDGLMIRRELTLKGVDVGFTSVKIPKQAKDDMEKTASTYSNNADRAQKLMTQRRQLEPYKIPAATREVNLALKEGRQAIVFVSRVNDSSTPSGVSTATAGALRKQLALAGITDVAELHGSADIDRTEAAKRFQSSKAKVLITTLESGGTGINLDDVVGDKPRTIVMMTPPFSAVENVQAIGRVWRYNTKSMPQVKYLFSDTAVDQWNQAIIETKMRSLEANVKGEINALKVPLPRTDSLPRNPMTSFSFGSLLAFNKDGVGVPCGQSSMSKGETCHVGKGDGRSDGLPEKFLSKPSQKMNLLNLDSLLSFRQDKKCKPTSLKCGDTCLSKARNPNGCKDPSGKKNGKGSNDRLREIRGNREETKALSKSILSNPQNIFYRARVAKPDGNDAIAQRKQKIAESILRAAERKAEKSERQENIREAQQRSSRISSLKTKAAKADPIALIFELREMKKRGESGSYDEKSMARDHVEVFQAELDKRIEAYRSSRS
jgi:late competence protein required for DNA uptake (superfamily II DNA/RNA helicase)